LLAEEDFEVDRLDASSRDFLEDAIQDYNEMFGDSYDTSSDGFQNYYKDLSKRIRNRDLDLVIVVNMFLTGFDATTLNTLWVDKNLRQHGLVQAFSRTNRILNSVKTYGNIVTFRDLEDATNEAIALFGNKDARGIVLLKPYGDYYGDYETRVAELLQRYPLGQNLVGETNQKGFIALFGAILRLRNILQAFDDFVGNEILSPRDFQNYQSVYLDLYQDFRTITDADRESINDDVLFEIELIKQVEINVDYILMLVKKYQEGLGRDLGADKEIKAAIDRAVDSSVTLRSKKDLIQGFVDSLTVDAAVDADWRTFIEAAKRAELDRIISEESLDPIATQVFVTNAFRDGHLSEMGMAITEILPPVSRFSRTGERAAKKVVVLDKLNAYFERFFGLG
jgi:type I restriction enzyme R subunit